MCLMNGCNKNESGINRNFTSWVQSQTVRTKYRSKTFYHTITDVYNQNTIMKAGKMYFGGCQININLYLHLADAFI